LNTPSVASGHDSRPVDAIPSFDPSVPHPARIYACWLGGKDHFEADRKAAEDVMRLRPQVVAGARANRYFLAAFAQIWRRPLGPGKKGHKLRL